MTIEYGGAVLPVMLATAFTLFVMGLFQASRRYGGSKEWKGWPAIRARMQGFAVMTGGLLVAIFAYSYWLPLGAEFEAAQQRLSATQSGNAALRKERDQLTLENSQLRELQNDLKDNENSFDELTGKFNALKAASKAQSDLLTVLLEREKKSRRKIADLLLDVQAQRAKNADLVKEKAALEAARLNLSAKLKQLQGEFDILREKEARARDALGLINAVKRATQGQ